MPRPAPRPRYVLVSVNEARKTTGLTSVQLRSLRGTQTVTRIFADGRRETALRLPAELLPGH